MYYIVLHIMHVHAHLILVCILTSHDWEYQNQEKISPTLNLCIHMYVELALGKLDVIVLPRCVEHEYY